LALVTSMSARLDEPDPLLAPSASDGVRLQAPPKAVVRLAGAAIVVLAIAGLARGVMVARPTNSDGSPLSVLTGLSSAAAANAKPAVILPRDDNWSTLSGPHMVDPSQKPKVEAKPVASDDEADDSESPAAQTAATDAIAPDAPDATPPSTPAASSTAAQPEPPPAAPPPGE
jgi:hypothetical protein